MPKFSRCNSTGSCTIEQPLVAPTKVKDEGFGLGSINVNFRLGPHDKIEIKVTENGNEKVNKSF